MWVSWVIAVWEQDAGKVFYTSISEAVSCNTGKIVSVFQDTNWSSEHSNWSEFQ